MKCPKCEMEMTFQGQAELWLNLVEHETKPRFAFYGFGEVEEKVLESIKHKRWYCDECGEIVPFIEKGKFINR